MNCPKCNAILSKGSNTCLNCGYRVSVKLRTRKFKEDVTNNESSLSIVPDESIAEEKEKNNSDTWQSLKDYLQSVFILECQRKEINDTIDELNRQISESPNKNPPEKKPYPQVEMKEIEKPNKEFNWKGCVSSTLLGLYCVYIGIVGGIFMKHYMMLLFAIFGSFSICAAVVSLRDDAQKDRAALNKYNIDVQAEKNRCDTENQKAKERIDEEYELTLSEYKETYKKECEEYEKKLKTLNSALKDLDDMLSQAYQKDIIHSKYRSLKAVTHLYDYVSTGRCKSLDGTDGAYAVYEEYLKVEMVNLSVKNFEEKLEEKLSELKKEIEFVKFSNSMQSEYESVQRNWEASRIIDQLRDMNSSIIRNTY